MDCSAGQVITLFEQAAELNRQERGDSNLIPLPDYGQVVMTGDLHGNIGNFRKLQAFADLDRYAERHVVLHEMIHCMDQQFSGNDGGGDGSCMLLMQVAKWKTLFPDQVHLLLGNHGIAQITGREICKGGSASVAGFTGWVCQRFGDDGARVLEAVCKFLFSCALGIRTPNRIFLSHSLPNPKDMDRFDVEVFDRPLRQEDILPGGQAYMLTWGRGHDAQQLDRLAEMLDVDFFLTGHQPQESGFACHHDRLIILASEHNQGCFLPIDLSKQYTFSQLAKRIRKFSEIPITLDEQ